MTTRFQHKDKLTRSRISVFPATEEKSYVRSSPIDVGHGVTAHIRNRQQENSKQTHSLTFEIPKGTLGLKLTLPLIKTTPFVEIKTNQGFLLAKVHTNFELRDRVYPYVIGMYNEHNGDLDSLYILTPENPSWADTRGIQLKVDSVTDQLEIITTTTEESSKQVLLIAEGEFQEVVLQVAVKNEAYSGDATIASTINFSGDQSLNP